MKAPRHFFTENVTFYDGRTTSMDPQNIDPRVCEYFVKYWRPERDNLVPPPLNCVAVGSPLPGSTSTGGGTGGTGTTTSGGTADNHGRDRRHRDHHRRRHEYQHWDDHGQFSDHQRHNDWQYDHQHDDWLQHVHRRGVEPVRGAARARLDCSLHVR